MKTSELTGAALCFAACMAEMPELVWGKTIGMHEHSSQIIVPGLQDPFCYSPFTNWGMCGPIIEREKMNMSYQQHDNFPGICWTAYSGNGNPGKGYSGPTLLISAMRCYIASKLGIYVDLPCELT